jgi:molybdenum cofactor cytidylyltransferase
MKFGPVPLEAAEGRILAHNITDSDGRRVLRKGRPLDAAALDTLRSLGHERIYVAELEQDDVLEDAASARVAGVMLGPGVEADRPHTGRVNLAATALGVLEVNVEALERLNQIEGFTIATLRTHSVVAPGERVGTVKVIPYAVPWEAVSRAEALAGAQPIVAVRPIPPQRVAIVLVGSTGSRAVLEEGLGRAIGARVEKLGCEIGWVSFSPLDERTLEVVLKETVADGCAMIVVAGETAIMDTNDLIPRGIRGAGGRVEHLGLAMDPGHLLLLAYLGSVPVVGAPGCVRGRTPDGFDAVLPRLLAGERLARSDLQALGHGGLLANPRSRDH